MICVYPAACTDFSGNGLGVVQPQSCTVTETLNGEWELTLVHPIDEYGKWTRLSEGNILRAPVPAAMTPRIRISVPGEDTRRDVYQVDTDTPEASVRGGTLRLRTGPGERYSVLRQYANGTEVQVLSKTNAQWYEVVLPDGKRGYMSTTFLRYVRTEGSVSEAVNAVVDARQLRDQPFRIYRVVPELSKVTVYARHIFYDLLDNMVKSLRPSSSAAGAAAVQGLSSACLSGHGFTFYSDLTSTAQDVSLENVNPVEALLGEGGLAEKYGGELTRDWFDVFLVRRVGADSDVQIREGKYNPNYEGGNIMRDFSIDLVWAKLQMAIAAVGGWLGYFVGGVDGLMTALLVLMVMDYVTGVMCAVIDRELSSSVGFRGIFKKVLILMLVGVAHIVDLHVVRSGEALRSAVICFYLSNEGVSVLENAGHLGLPIPEKLKGILAQLHDRMEEPDETEDGGE